MSTILVKTLKDRLKDALYILENYNEEDEVELVSNTYYLSDPNNYLGTSQGFVDLNNLDSKIISNSDDEDDYPENAD